MRKEKSQDQRIMEFYITAVVVICSVMLVFSGIAISKINTDYMSTGVRPAKIVAERQNEEIFVSFNDKKFVADKTFYDKLDKVLTFSPPPINCIYLTAKEISNIKKQ